MYDCRFVLVVGIRDWLGWFRRFMILVWMEPWGSVSYQGCGVGMCEHAIRRLPTRAVCCLLVRLCVFGTCLVLWGELRHPMLSACTIASLIVWIVLVIGWVGFVVWCSRCGWRHWGVYHIHVVVCGCVNMSCVDVLRVRSVV